MGLRMSSHCRSVAASLSASALILTGCALDRTDAEELASDLDATYSADYEPAVSPKELSSRSTLVVEGNLSDFIEGREIAGTPGTSTPSRNITMVVDVESTLVGQEVKTVYVEIPSPGNVPATDYANPSESFPVLLYLIPAERTDDIRDLDAGRPKGEPLYRPTTPQGFMAKTDAGALQILDFREYEGASLDQFYPAMTYFPEPDSPREGG